MESEQSPIPGDMETPFHLCWPTSEYLSIHQIKIWDYLIGVASVGGETFAWLDNAIKYTPSGSVRVETRLEEGRLSIHVIDTGPGISAALRETIFRPFERSKQETVEGTGIGLAVCHGLVTRMGGRLQLHSEEGAGSDFFFDLAVPDPMG